MKSWTLIRETNSFVAINKPSGLLTLPDRFDQEKDSLKNQLSMQMGRIWIVHRLDRDTSGLILFARTEEAHKYYSSLFEQHRIDKIYLGLVEGSLHSKSGLVDAPIAAHPAMPGRMIISAKGKTAITRYEVLEDWGTYSWIQFKIETGRTHQIRIHMKQLGHPLVADPLYGSGQPLLLSRIKKNYKASKNDLEEKPLLNRLGLHAWKLSFTDLNGEKVELEAPLPRDLQATLKQLQKWKSGI